jgi:hypothetical protein
MQPVRIGGLGLTLLEGRALTAPGLFLDGQVGECVGWCVGSVICCDIHDVGL